VYTQIEQGCQGLLARIKQAYHHKWSGGLTIHWRLFLLVVAWWREVNGYDGQKIGWCIY
jgi:hypothetical protein